MIINILIIFSTILMVWIVWTIKNLPQEISKHILEAKKAEFQMEINKDSKLHEKRIETVINFLKYMNSILADSSKIKRKEKEIGNKMIEFGIELILFASDETILKYEEFRDIENSNSNILKVYGEFVIAIRKDLGYSKTELKPEDFLKLILKESKEEIKDLISKNTH